MKTKILAMLALLTVVGLNAPVKVAFKDLETGATVGEKNYSGSLQELATTLRVNSFEPGSRLPFHSREDEVMGGILKRPEYIDEQYVVKGVEEGSDASPAHLEIDVVKLEPHNMKVVDGFCCDAEYPVMDLQTRAFYQIYYPAVPRLAHSSVFNAKKLDGAWIISILEGRAKPILRNGKQVWVPLNEVTLKILSPKWCNILLGGNEAKDAWSQIWTAMDEAGVSTQPAAG